MSKIVDKLWNWGHLAGSHNSMINLDCKMSPEAFAEEYGIKNTFMVSYGGNIQPPFAPYADKLTSLNEVVWSVLGDGSSPIPEAELGNTNDVIEVAKTFKNITGGVVDDFFSPVRLERFGPDILMKIKKALNDRGLKFWCVLYAHQLDEKANLDDVEKYQPLIDKYDDVNCFDDVINKYLDCFDGITFWIWKCEDIANINEYYEEVKKRAKGKELMLGVYLWDYSVCKLMDSELFEKQLEFCFDKIEKKEISGMIVCSNTIGDADLETNKILKRHIELYGNKEID